MSRGPLALGVALVAALLACALAATPAHAAPAPVPCQAIGGGKYSCQWYEPGDGIHGGAIVQSEGRTVGYLHQGTNWIVCQQSGASVYDSEGDKNTWYGYTEADDGAWGWASALDARGGDDFGSFSAAPNCNGAHGAAPSQAGLWGAPISRQPPPGQPVTGPPPPGNPPPAPVSRDYGETMADGFDAAPGGSQRTTLDSGVRTGDDGVIVLRWFIPAHTAAGGLLLGDGRGFSDDPAADGASRAYLVWDVASGKVSLTVNHSTLRTGHQIAALRLVTHRRCSEVQSTDLGARDTNEVYAGRDGSSLEICASLLNSLTNDLPLPFGLSGVGAWSVDYDIEITPHNTESGDVASVTARPVGAAHQEPTVHHRRSAHRGRRGAGSTAALVRRVRHCGRWTGRRCARLRRSLRRDARHRRRSGHWTPRDARRVWSRVNGCRRGARKGCAGRLMMNGLPPADGYDFSVRGNGYPALESYYYPRHIEGAHMLLLRKVDPEMLGSAIDAGGGLGALDMASWFQCFSDPSHRLGSACGWSPDMYNPSRDHDSYITHVNDRAG